MLMRFVTVPYIIGATLLTALLIKSNVALCSFGCKGTPYRPTENYARRAIPVDRGGHHRSFLIFGQTRDLGLLWSEASRSGEICNRCRIAYYRFYRAPQPLSKIHFVRSSWPTLRSAVLGAPVHGLYLPQGSVATILPSAAATLILAARFPRSSS